jgi:hypothetical protein
MPSKKEPIPYVFLGSAHELNLRFYERYDEHFLFNKVATFLYIISEGEPAIRQIEECLIANGGTNLSNRYLESIRAEVFFTTLHQCETFFALLIALFQPLPHWIFLTTYETSDIKQAVEYIIADQIDELTGGEISNIRDFIQIAIYHGSKSADPELANKWDENIDNAAWLIKRIGEYFLMYDRAYNSYKHGLRVMLGPHQLKIGLNNPDGTLAGPMHIIQQSGDAVMYLQKNPMREVNGAKEIPISEVTKAFNPFEASFFLAKMCQMLETIKATRLTALKGGGPVESINTFFHLDKDELRLLSKHDQWERGPARADEARLYTLFFEQIKANAEQQKQANHHTEDTETNSQ